MTNMKWINSLDAEELSKLIHKYSLEKPTAMPWCNSHENCPGHKECQDCILLWLLSNKVEQMPTLKAGMFVRLGPEDGNLRGVIVEGKEGANIVYESGGFDPLEKRMNNIYYVYNENCLCFRGCNEENILWRKY